MLTPVCVVYTLCYIIFVLRSLLVVFHISSTPKSNPIDRSINQIPGLFRRERGREGWRCVCFIHSVSSSYPVIFFLGPGGTIFQLDMSLSRKTHTGWRWADGWEGRARWVMGDGDGG
ncbi:hypothetical protein QBC47DRAFT_375379 [Echria macrotheca]|uniref:Uncharacterized protein n=1 Tax=Echria macrotheca TaxID=438768 RepID=A0AAJ0BK78_9PEZI|nr:hypothetical protein QBC47DRAFT_375379 [Echria macrotheca]